MFGKLNKILLGILFFTAGYKAAASSFDSEKTFINVYSEISGTPIDWNKFLVDIKSGLATFDPYTPVTEDRSQISDFKTYLVLLNIVKYFGEGVFKQTAIDRIEKLRIMFKTKDSSQFFKRFEDEVHSFQSHNGDLADISNAPSPKNCYGTFKQLAWQIAYGFSPILLLETDKYLNPAVSHAVDQNYGETVTDENRFTVHSEDKNFTIFTNMASFIAKVSSTKKPESIALLKSVLQTNKRLADCATAEIGKRDSRMLAKKDSIRAFFNNRVVYLQNTLKELGE